MSVAITINENLHADEFKIKTPTEEDEFKIPRLEHQASSKESSNLTRKKNILEHHIKTCAAKAAKYLTRYEKLKKRDDRLDFIKDTLNALNVGLIVAGIAIPFILWIALGCGVGNFVFSRWSQTLNLKEKYGKDSMAANQLRDLCREMTAVLLKNNLSSEATDSLLSEMNSRISLIEQSAIPI